MPVSRFEFPLSFSYDLAARLSTQTDSSGTFAWSCTPWNGLPAAVTNLDCGLSVAYEYDVLDRITSIHWRKANGATLRSFGYAFDRAGNITNLLMESEALPSRTTDYGYDMLDRLTAETSPGRANAWSYDLAGNRTNAVLNGTSTACTLGVGDRLAATSDGASYLYNAAGCVTNISSASYVVSLSWDSRYQLDAAYTNGVLAETYQYDALGRRVATTSGGTTTCHVYDGGWQVLADLDADGQPLRSYTWGPGIDHLLAMTTYGSTTNTYYALTDHLGTVHALVDFSGAIAESYEFDAWGNVLAIHDASGSPIGNRQSETVTSGKAASAASPLASATSACAGTTPPPAAGSPTTRLG